MDHLDEEAQRARERFARGNPRELELVLVHLWRVVDLCDVFLATHNDDCECAYCMDEGGPAPENDVRGLLYNANLAANLLESELFPFPEKHARHAEQNRRHQGAEEAWVAEMLRQCNREARGLAPASACAVVAPPLANASPAGPAQPAPPLPFGCDGSVWCRCDRCKAKRTAPEGSQRSPVHG